MKKYVTDMPVILVVEQKSTRNAQTGRSDDGFQVPDINIINDLDLIKRSAEQRSGNGNR